MVMDRVCWMSNGSSPQPVLCDLSGRQPLFHCLCNLNRPGFTFCWAQWFLELGQRQTKLAARSDMRD